MSPQHMTDPDIRVTPGTTRTAGVTVTAVTDRQQPHGPCRVQVQGDLYHGRVPDGAIYVGRAAPGLKASPFRNEHRAGAFCHRCGREHDRASAVAAYRADYNRQPELVERARQELTGHDLACWCKPPLICHVDALLDLLYGGAR